METLGNYLPLKIIRITDEGAWLIAGHDEILLPRKELASDAKEGNSIKVFVFKDGKDQLTATTKKPLALLNECAYLKIKENASIGSFLDWGIEKDLFLPFREQKEAARIGQPILVFVHIDDDSNRIVASGRMNKFISNDKVDLKEGDEVNILICNETDLGYNVIIENKHWGLIYKNEVFRNIVKGEKCKGYIKKLRAENKIDVSLQKQGYDEVETAYELILQKLKENNGFLALTDKSAPENIYKILQMSKKTFKKSIGRLFRNKKIDLKDDGISLIA
jgi:uncharacterized protein